MPAMTQQPFNSVIQRARVIVGVILTPIVPAVCFAIPELSNPNAFGLNFFLAIAAFTGYPVLFLFGPIFFREFVNGKKKKFFRICGIGAILGGFAFLSIFVFGLLSGKEAVLNVFKSTYLLLPVSMICGILGGIWFWCAAIYKNPLLEK